MCNFEEFHALNIHIYCNATNFSYFFLCMFFISSNKFIEIYNEDIQFILYKNVLHTEIP